MDEKNKRPKVSIILRTKNEEQWIAHTLQMIQTQSIQDVEIVIVDNQSADHTLEIARKFPVKIVEIEKFYPGQALNSGIRVSSGEFIVCLSAHCIPKHEKWLENLLRNFEMTDCKVGGVYGRQIPFKYSSDIDKRDLLITFGLDKRIQEKDTFFHNANSMLPRALWDQIPFDSEITNIEDRVWAQEIIKAGYRIVYEPEAEVFHCHGIHQNNIKQRYEQTVKIMENLHVDFRGDIPKSFKPGQLKVAAFVPTIGQLKTINGVNLFTRTIAQLKACPYIKDVVAISEQNEVLRFAETEKIKAIKRGPEYLARGKSIENTLNFTLWEYEKKYGITDAVLFVNYLFPFRPENFFSDLIEHFSYTGSDSTIAAIKRYRVFWFYGEKGYETMEGNFKPRNERKPIYEGLVGLGCITSSRFIRKGSVLGDQVELLDIKDPKCAIKVEDAYSEEIAKFLLEQEAGIEQQM